MLTIVAPPASSKNGLHRGVRRTARSSAENPINHNRRQRVMVHFPCGMVIVDSLGLERFVEFALGHLWSTELPSLVWTHAPLAWPSLPIPQTRPHARDLGRNLTARRLSCGWNMAFSESSSLLTFANDSADFEHPYYIQIRNTTQNIQEENTVAATPVTRPAIATGIPVCVPDSRA